MSRLLRAGFALVALCSAVVLVLGSPTICFANNYYVYNSQGNWGSGTFEVGDKVSIFTTPNNILSGSPNNVASTYIWDTSTRYLETGWTNNTNPIVYYAFVARQDSGSQQVLDWPSSPTENAQTWYYYEINYYDTGSHTWRVNCAGKKTFSYIMNYLTSGGTPATSCEDNNILDQHRADYSDEEFKETNGSWYMYNNQVDYDYDPSGADSGLQDTVNPSNAHYRSDFSGKRDLSVY
jgi:hypothetical protein